MAEARTETLLSQSQPLGSRPAPTSGAARPKLRPKSAVDLGAAPRLLET